MTVVPSPAAPPPTGPPAPLPAATGIAGPRPDLQRALGGRFAGGVSGSSDLAAEVRRALAALWRYRLLIAFTLIMGTLASALFAVSIPSKFSASARILVGAANPELIENTNSDALDQVLGNDIIIESETEILQSRDLLADVIRNSGLLYDPNANPRLGWDGEEDDGIAYDAGVMANMTESFLENLYVGQVGRSRIIIIDYTDSSPARAAYFANAVAQTYLDRQVREKRAVADATAAALEERIRTLRDEVARLETEIARERGAVDLPESGRLAVLGERVGVLSDRITDSRARLATLNAQRREMLSALENNRLAAPTAFQTAPILAALREQKAFALTALAQAEAIYVPDHPEVQSARAVVASIDAALREEFLTIAEELRAEAEAEAAGLAELERVAVELRSEESRIGDAGIRIRALERDADSARTILEAFLGRLAEVRELQGTERPDAAIISRANPPKHASAPNRKLLVAGGFVASGFLSLLLVVLLELTDNRLLTREQAESWTRLPVLASLPDLGPTIPGGPEPSDVIVDRPGSAFADAVRALHLALVPPDGGVPPGVILVTGPEQGEGKTTVSLALGRALTLEAGLSAIVVEANRLHPKIAERTGVEEAFGLIDHVRDGVELARVIQIDRASQLQVLRSGIKDAQGLRLQDFRIGAAIRQLRARYDAVIIDTSGLLDSADAAAWGAVSDGILFVVSAGSSRETQITAALRSMRSLNDRILGLVLNRIEDA